MIYLKEFETTNQYNAYTADTENFILPNVSLTVDNNTVYYNPFEDPYKGHEYVEIGGLKWATMNVGATSITDYGLYFQWGDTSGYTASQVGSGEGKKYFDWSDYKYWTSDTGSGESGFIKYNSTDGKTVLDASDDAVQTNWGGEWRMPTKEEFGALINATTSVWTSNYEGSGVSGRVLTDKTDSSKTLFFPAAGDCSNGRVSNVASRGFYWSSSLSDNVYYAYGLDFGNRYTYWENTYPRYMGMTVRGVVG